MLSRLVTIQRVSPVPPPGASEKQKEQQPGDNPEHGGVALRPWRALALLLPSVLSGISGEQGLILADNDMQSQRRHSGVRAPYRGGMPHAASAPSCYAVSTYQLDRWLRWCAAHSIEPLQAQRTDVETYISPLSHDEWPSPNAPTI
ncbi:hypothetical protein [Pedococcus sp. 2YAF34]|uniref:hypothetical protein n=1 Tax=Pedococcus sp. 2YAF34 TaxID=3233032 RepID=UPI003F95AE25